jgi:hypothetical protein
MKIWIGWLVLFVAAQAASAEAGPAKEIVSKDPNFSVIMPCEPEYKATPVETAQGTITTHQYQCDAGGFLAMMMHLQMPDASGDVEQRLDGARDGAVRRTRGGRLIAEEKITVGGYPGREIRMEATGDLLGISRFVIVQKDRRMYSLITMTKKAGAPEAEMKAFLRSLQLLDK